MLEAPVVDIRYTKDPTLQDVLSALRSQSNEDQALVRRAWEFAQKAHEGQERLSGKPYFTHVAETGYKLARIGMGAPTVAAGLLHDAVEDGCVSFEELEKAFGAEIASLVDGVTKLGHLKYRGVSRHVESLRKLFVATSRDIRVLIIRLMDRLHNMETLEYVREDKRRRIALETLEIYAPIAERLEMGIVQRMLQDLAFPYVFPEEYKEVHALVEHRANRLLRSMEKMQNRMRRALVEAGITEFHTMTRLKGLYSFWRKLQRKGGDANQIYDLAALRIIVPTKEDCYRVLGIVHHHWRPLPGRIKDYIAFPKPNGYQSLHTTVFTGDGSIVEVQVRTLDMHREAQWGVASHFAYKEQGSVAQTKKDRGWLWVWRLLPRRQQPSATEDGAFAPSDETGRRDIDIPQWVREIAEAQRAVAEGDESFLEDLRADFFNHRVFVFTPKGDVVDLPIGASPVDFAYAIHSDIGAHLAAAIVNGKMVSLDTQLRNGDIVEVVTKPSARPSRRWLAFVKTALARRKIRQALAVDNLAASAEASGGAQDASLERTARKRRKK
ncbi:bifunctional (p)ppGpp synthetase/guanosine-3',5'-bis(diphosphate) 3'-pyrophosphohydrolase [Candidatus Parcubacteria bacterium]|nr:MAG: bifunctional (p)ppGpp synthetase/guanosine-3',5'-bis(diphosphate) 3'-pyrophosphohydrolase [Candidatus Parcubacteria bacterium]